MLERFNGIAAMRLVVLFVRKKKKIIVTGARYSPKV